MADHRFWRTAVRVIDFFRQTEHCRQSYASEAARSHSPKEFTDRRQHEQNTLE